MGAQIFREEHEIFRRSLRSFLEKEVKPHLEEWRRNRQIPREIWRKMGEQGFIGYWLDEKYGGVGADFVYSVVLIEEIQRSGAWGLGRPSGFTTTSPCPISRCSGPRNKNCAGFRSAAGGIHRGHRHDRTGGGLRPPGHPHRGGARRGRLRHQRAKDLYHQRVLLRSDRPGRENRSEGSAALQRGFFDRGGKRDARIHQEPQARKNGTPFVGHGRAIL